MEAVKGGVTAPAGFLASGVFCGIKKRGRDLALVASERPAWAAGCLTANRLQAPCVDWNRRALARGMARAIVVNSGNANCCTGRRGTADCRTMAAETARQLGVPARQVLVASTGVIGRFLPMSKVRRGIARAAESLHSRGSGLAAEAIMTTDTRPKEIAIRFKLDGKPVLVGGIAKGSGMVAPNLEAIERRACPERRSSFDLAQDERSRRAATMLAFLTTDACVEQEALQQALNRWVSSTFNAITVDGETSTNDMVLALANGASQTPRLRPGTAAHGRFLEAVGAVCRTLAHEIIRDGEGVTRVFRVRVTGGKDACAADRVARRIANSMLVKTMVAGRDPNWGRVAAAVGAAGVAIPPRRLVIRLGRTAVFRKGEPVRVARSVLLKEVDKPEFEIGVELGSGLGQAEILSGDLTEGYVRINAKYTT